MNPLRFDGKVAIVTGAGRGLGREYAKLLALRGARVVVNDLGSAPDGAPTHETPAETVAGEINASGGIAIANHDSVVDGAEQIIASALDHFGQLDILVNNAGFASFDISGPFANIPVDIWEQMLGTHLDGTINMARAAWPYLSKSKAGRIINTSSAASFGAPFASHYSTAKSSMIGFTRSLAGEGLRFGMTVNALMPSAFTRLTAQIPNDPLRRYMSARFTPERVAPFVTWLAHETTHVNGEIFAVGGGMACRVILARAQGAARVSADTPEAWASEADHVLDINQTSVPLNMMEELCCELHLMDDEGKALAETLRSNQHLGGHPGGKTP